MSTPIEIFKQAMRSAGIEPPAEVIADNVLHRFTVAGDRAHSNNGWYVLYNDEPAAGAFGCWKRGISETWSDKTYQTMTPAEKIAYTAKMETVKRQRDKERERIQTECRAWCADAWSNAKDATNENGYLKRKGVNAYGLKSFKDSLLVPVQDMEGTFHGLQFIAQDGSKKFKTGTNKAGHFFNIGKSKDKTIIICEGYATGASIYQATGHAVVIAFDSGNLLPTAQIIRSKYPDKKIIFAADDDYQTEGNPGLAKATEAAKTVNGLLAVPTFPANREPMDSDFNDLARLAGSEAVLASIEAAAIASSATTVENTSQAESVSIINTLDAAIQRLAALSHLQYEQVRKTEAKSLGVRQATLDALVKAARKQKDDVGNLPFTETDPCPEQVDPATLLNEIKTVISRFIVCSKEVAVACGLWITMTWMIEKFDIAPYIVITSPEKRCGKTQLLSLLSKLSYRSIAASSITPSALFRSIEAWSPTLFIDEADACLKDNEELRGILNSGNSRDLAYVIRNVGDDHVPTKFNTFCPKAISGIGHISDTIEDRSIIMELRRKLPSQVCRSCHVL
jgi:putative DNA primase/helicase